MHKRTRRRPQLNIDSYVAEKPSLGIPIIAGLAVLVVALFAATWLVLALSDALVDSLDQDCVRYCETQGKEYGSLTVFGCVCTEPEV